jgi:hypothetical protein
MKRVRKTNTDIAPEYDFTGGVRGKYAREYQQGSNALVLDPDVAEVFTDSASVNGTLRVIVSLMKRRLKKNSAR